MGGEGEREMRRVRGRGGGKGEREGEGDGERGERKTMNLWKITLRMYVCMYVCSMCMHLINGLDHRFSNWSTVSDTGHTTITHNTKSKRMSAI